ncbi:unnamed protein product [Nyctereutes procyonoides]|uniref:(raccoon dog) hypothetical protein n=1 Tax=Nyctereutes procyonoides TaxID=34880 RepID=A0A811Y5W1_NYCPR|nr:unnamed protein product [Nyctereutes procyonoides]
MQGALRTEQRLTGSQGEEHRSNIGRRNSRSSKYTLEAGHKQNVHLNEYHQVSLKADAGLPKRLLKKIRLGLEVDSCLFQEWNGAVMTSKVPPIDSDA